MTYIFVNEAMVLLCKLMIGLIGLVDDFILLLHFRIPFSSYLSLGVRLLSVCMEKGGKSGSVN